MKQGRKSGEIEYCPPTGPKYQNSPGPGLRGGKNFGNVGSQNRKTLTAEASGRPGIKGTVLGDGFDQDDTGRV